MLERLLLALSLLAICASAYPACQTVKSGLWSDSTVGFFLQMCCSQLHRVQVWSCAGGGSASGGLGPASAIDVTINSWHRVVFDGMRSTKLRQLSFGSCFTVATPHTAYSIWHIKQHGSLSVMNNLPLGFGVMQLEELFVYGNMTW